MIKNFKVGIIGCGLIATHKYIPGFKKSGSKISAICDVNKALAEKTAQKFAVPKYYTDPYKMLSENKFDLVGISTPPHTHAELGLSVLKNDSHLFIEKPMALTVSDCDKLIQESKKRNKKICIGHSDLFYPPIIKAKELVSKGFIGKFRGMRVFLSTPYHYALSKKDHWIHKLPGGILSETGPHAVYLTGAFVNNINEAFVITKKNLAYEWINFDDIRIELKGENGISSITITHSTNQWDAKVDIFGSNKNLYIDMHEFLMQEHRRERLDAFSVGWRVFNKNIKSLFHVAKNVLLSSFNRTSYGHELLINKYIESIRKNTPSPVPPESGRETVRIMEMIMDSYNKINSVKKYI